MVHSFTEAAVEALIAEGMIADEDYYFNYDLWTGNVSNILFITGLSGSGKSTLAKRMADEFHADRFGLDDFLRDGYIVQDFANPAGQYSQFTPSMKPIVAEFMKHYGYGNVDSDDPTRLIITKKYIDASVFTRSTNFVDFLRTKYSGKKFVIEGVQIYYTEGVFDTVKDYPLIIKGIQTHQAIKRALKRNYKQKHFLTALIMDFFKNGGGTIEWYRSSASQLERFKKKMMAYVPEENQVRQASYSS